MSRRVLSAGGPRPLRCAAALTALLALATSQPVPAAVVEIAWSAQGRFEHTLSVVPGKFGEICGALDAGATVTWRFEAEVPMDFNIHHHVGKEVVFSAKEAARKSGTGRLVAPTRQDYCWMWSYKVEKTGTTPASAAAARPASVKVVLQR